MKLGLMVGYWGAQPPPDLIGRAKLAESAGYDSIWTAEAYGSDVVSPLCWIGAHTSTIKLGTGLMQISARTPASTAMTAATIDHLSGGRLILGLGVSGPQVVEGWYGQPFPKPLQRTKEYVEVVRKMLRREEPVTYDGDHYPLPYPGGAGLGKPLKITVHPLRREIPIYLGAEGPKNVKQTTKIADGWLPIFYSPYRNDMYEGITFPPGFEVACPVTVMITDDVEAALGFIKLSLSFYIGGMGAKDRNFHLDVVARMGFEGEAKHVQDLFMDGKREEAARAVPDALADEISLVGPKERIRDRLQAWEESPVSTILSGSNDEETVKVLPELLS
ncbi:MAG: LLM class F420-dependent oxidoreductase [Actinomycetota bacterium]